MDDLAEYFESARYDCTRPSSAYSACVVDEFIVVDDLGGQLKISDDAAVVVTDVIRRFGLLTIIFRHWQDRWNALMHERGCFVGFLQLSADTVDEAMDRYNDPLDGGAEIGSTYPGRISTPVRNISSSST